jgi:hypothetical protein
VEWSDTRLETPAALNPRCETNLVGPLERRPDSPCCPSPSLLPLHDSHLSHTHTPSTLQSYSVAATFTRNVSEVLGCSHLDLPNPSQQSSEVLTSSTSSPPRLL